MIDNHLLGELLGALFIFAVVMSFIGWMMHWWNAHD